MTNTWPQLPLADWETTRANLHHRARVAGAVPRALLEPHPHWWHISLRPVQRVLTTLPTPGTAGDFTIAVDLNEHAALVTGKSGPTEIPLGTPAAKFVERFSAAVAGHTATAIELPTGPADPAYESESVERFGAVLEAVAAEFEAFAMNLSEETSPVQLWPHHFDLSINWFSGRSVPNTDPADPEHHRESATVGFSTGDEAVPEPYFYGIAYPFPESLTDTPLTEPARWRAESFRGALLPYADIALRNRPAEELRRFLEAYYDAVAFPTR